MAPVLAVTQPDLWVFVIASVAVLVGAIGVVVSPHPVHSALMLIQTLFGVAVLFVAQQADFLAAVQVIVYAGAIVVLFLFVIMLIGVDQPENIAADPLPAQRPTAIALGVLALLELLLLAHINSGHWITGAPSLGGAANAPGGNVATLGRSIFTVYLWPFEITSVLLIIAVVGAVVLARRHPRQAVLDLDEADDDPAAPADASNEAVSS